MVVKTKKETEEWMKSLKTIKIDYYERILSFKQEKKYNE